MELASAIGNGRLTKITPGSTLTAARASNVSVQIRIRNPRGRNQHGDTPQVQRVDIIAGDITGPATDRTVDVHTSARVVERFSSEDWIQEGEYITMTYTFTDAQRSFYFRLRGTNTGQLEPELDPRGENPWSDLWFLREPDFRYGPITSYKLSKSVTGSHKRLLTQ